MMDILPYEVSTKRGEGQFSVDVPAHGTATLVVPDQPGTYPFHCKYHSFMHGTMTVS